jgi:hypothetical protein
VLGPGGIIALHIAFSKPMNQARASAVGNYGYFVTSPGPDGKYGTFDDTFTAIAAAGYNPANRTAVVVFAKPLPLNRVYKIVLDRDAAAGTPRGLTDLSGNLLDGTGTGRFPGSQYVTTFTVPGNVPHVAASRLKAFSRKK